MALTISHIVWYDEVLWGDLGEVGKWARQVSTALTYATWAEAPMNKRAVKTSGFPGELKTSIRTRSENRTGLRSRDFTISMVSYGAYVIRGTQGPIRPDSGNWLALPMGLPGASGLSPIRSYHRSVSGQSSNDFLGRAWDTVAAKHPALRGKLRYN